MANRDVVSLFSKFGLVALVIFGLLSFTITMQSGGDAEQPLTEDSRFGNTFLNLSEELENLNSTSNQWNNFKSENPIVGFGSIVLFGIVNVGKTFGTLIFNIFAIIIKLPVLVLQIPSTITSILLSWLVITLIVALWILYKLGG